MRPDLRLEQSLARLLQRSGALICTGPHRHNHRVMPTSRLEQMPSLAARLRAIINRDGPISFHDWMQVALYDEREGYYCRSDRARWGCGGDYRTAPERSPLFARTFANYFMKSYFDLGAPSRWSIVEVGAGAGDFARGVLLSLQANYPNIFAATHYVIDEVSPDALAQARVKLAEFGDRVEFRRLAEITESFPQAIIFANELIDAFPVHRVIGRNGNLRELRVSLSDSDEFIWVDEDLDARVAEYCTRVQLELAEGQSTEVNLTAEDFVSRAAALLDRGLLITVDYGAERDELLAAPHRFNGTLRSFRQHLMIDDVLANPGQQDLTATIDWTQIMAAGERSGLEILRFEPLDHFLSSEGLLAALSEMVTTNHDPVEAVRLTASAREMIMPDGMASSFQVLVQRKCE